MTVFLNKVSARHKEREWKKYYRESLAELRQTFIEDKYPQNLIKQELEQMPGVWRAMFESSWAKFEILARIEQILYRGGYDETDVEKLYDRLMPKLHLLWNLESLERQLKALCEKGELYEHVLQAIMKPYIELEEISDVSAYIAKLHAREAELKAIVDALPAAQLASGALNKLSLGDDEADTSSSSKDKSSPPAKRNRPSY